MAATRLSNKSHMIKRIRCFTRCSCPSQGSLGKDHILLVTYRLRMRMDFAGVQWVAGSGAPIAMYSQIEVGCGTGSPCNRKPSM